MNIRILALSLAAALMAAAGPARAQSGSVDAAEHSTVRVALILQTWQGRFLHSTGSGFVVAPNLVVTNAHVVSALQEYPNISVAIIAPDGRGPAEAQVISFAPGNDLALLRFAGASPPALSISTIEPRTGDPIVALGYPDIDDLQRPAIELVRPTEPSRSSGDIASLRDRAPTGDPIPTINHEAAISSGSSGGPLLDPCGRVIGVNTWHARGEETFQGRGVATRITQLIKFLSQAGVRPQTTNERCLSELERAQADRDAAVATLQRQSAEIADKLETTDRLARITLIALAAGIVLFLLAVGTLALAWFGVRPRVPTGAAPAPPSPVSGAEPQASAFGEAASAPQRIVFPAMMRKPNFWPIALIVTAAIIAALIIIPLALQIMSAREPLQIGRLPAELTGTQECTIDPGQTRSSETDTATFRIDATACVNGRTLYAPSLDGRSLQRVLIHEDNGTLDVLTLAPRSGVFRREQFAIAGEARMQAIAAAQSNPAPQACSISDAARLQVARRNAALLAFAHGTPRERVVWRCRRTE